MAERRMFAKTIIDSDAFLEMPQSSQLLYFHLSMRADDDGFINKPKAIMNMVGCKSDDMNILALRKFIIPFESGIVVIKHWKIHNFIAKDRYSETKYKIEKSALELDENKAYKIVNDNVSTDCIQVVNEMDTQVRLVKDSIVKDSIVKEREYIEYNTGEENEENDLSISSSLTRNEPVQYLKIKEIYNQTCKSLPKILEMTKKRKDKLKGLIRHIEGGEETIKRLFAKAEESDFLSGRNGNWNSCNFDWLINYNNAIKVLEGNYDNKAGDKQEKSSNIFYEIGVEEGLWTESKQ